VARAAATKQLIHIFDYAEEPAYKQRDPVAVRMVELAGARTIVVVPMLKENEVIGTIHIYRQEVRPFTDKQIELVQNYAALANAFRVMFSGADAVATTLSSIRTPPKGLSSSTTAQSMWARRESACAAASSESIR
jgi:hypothetical protein